MPLAKYVAELSEDKPALEGRGASVGQLLDEWTALGQQRGWTPYTEHRYCSYVEGRIRPELGGIKLTKFGPETRAPSADGITRIVNAAHRLDPVKAELLVVAAMTGARRGELRALKWSDVDWDRRTLTIARSLTSTPDVTVEGTTKTKKSRTISLGAMAVEHLKVHRERSSDQARAGGVGLSKDAHVISTALDGSAPVKPDSLTQFHARLMKKLGMGYRFHELRHVMDHPSPPPASAFAPSPVDWATPIRR
jgi:integrase